MAQALLLFGAETWVLTQCMEQALGSFQSRFARRITRKHTGQGTDGSWDYPPLAEAMGGAGLEGIRKSFTRRQIIVVQYIATRPILDLCERAIRRLVVRLYRQWWEQDGIDLEGEKKRVAETTTISDLEEEEEVDMGRNEESGEEEEYQGTSGSSGEE